MPARSGRGTAPGFACGGRAVDRLHLMQPVHRGTRRNRSWSQPTSCTRADTTSSATGSPSTVRVGRSVPVRALSLDPVLPRVGHVHRRPHAHPGVGVDVEHLVRLAVLVLGSRAGGSASASLPSPQCHSVRLRGRLDLDVPAEQRAPSGPWRSVVVVKKLVSKLISVRPPTGWTTSSACGHSIVLITAQTALPGDHLELVLLAGGQTDDGVGAGRRLRGCRSAASAPTTAFPASPRGMVQARRWIALPAGRPRPCTAGRIGTRTRWPSAESMYGSELRAAAEAVRPSVLQQAELPSGLGTTAALALVQRPARPARQQTSRRTSTTRRVDRHATPRRALRRVQLAQWLDDEP